MVKESTGVKGSAISVGERVAVPIGTSDVIGTVLEIYGPVSAPKAMVEVGVYGSTGYTLERKATSYSLSALRPLRSMTVEELGSLLRRYRPVAALVQPGEEPPIWHWEPFEDVQTELRRRGLSDADINDLAWGWHEEDDS